MSLKKRKTPVRRKCEGRISLQWCAQGGRCAQNLESGQSHSVPCAGDALEGHGPGRALQGGGREREEGVVGGSGAGPHSHAGRAGPHGPWGEAKENQEGMQSPLLPYSWSLQVRVEAHGQGRVGKGSLALLMLYPLYR